MTPVFSITLARFAVVAPLVMHYIEFSLFMDYSKKQDGLKEVKKSGFVFPFNGFVHMVGKAVGFEIGWAEGCECHKDFMFLDQPFAKRRRLM